MKLILFNLKTDADDDLLGFATNWINSIADRCERVFVITLETGRISVRDNVTVYSVGREMNRDRLSLVLEFYRILSQILKNDRIDGCFAHMNHHFTALAGPILRAKKIPIVQWHCHKSTPLLLRIAYHFSEVIITASPEGCRLQSGSSVISGHGIDMSKFKIVVEESDGPLVLLYVGRIAPIKRLELLLEAGGWLNQIHPELEFQIKIVGNASEENADYKNRLLQLVRGLRLERKVHFLGGCGYLQIAHHFQRADLCFNGCPEGGLDKVMLEAMCCGIPVLTTNPALKHTWPSELGDGWFCSERDDAAVFGQKIVDWAKCPMRKSTGFKNKLRGSVRKHHDLNKLSGRLISLFKKSRNGSSEDCQHR